jgi:hypothetical protein
MFISSFRSIAFLCWLGPKGPADPQKSNEFKIYAKTKRWGMWNTGPSSSKRGPGSSTMYNAQVRPWIFENV